MIVAMKVALYLVRTCTRCENRCAHAQGLALPDRIGGRTRNAHARLITSQVGESEHDRRRLWPGSTIA